jgi:hypothetical protein
VPRAGGAGSGHRLRRSLDREGAAEPGDETGADGGAEVAQILPEYDRSCRGPDRPHAQLPPRDLDLHAVEATVAERRLDEGRDPALDGGDVRLERSTGAGDVHPLLAEPLGRRAGELERIRLAEGGLVAPGLDPRRERQLVDQLRDLRRGGVDHLDVPVGRRRETVALEGLRETVHRRKRRTKVVAGEGDETGERGVVGHGAV